MYRFATRLFAATCAALLWTGGVRAADAPKPNVLFILADDLGWEDVSFNGGPIKTPNIDTVAAKGAKLTNYYVQPLCSPTRSCLMSGLYPIRNGLQVSVVRPWADYGLPLDRKTLPQGLKEAGYETAITGKWHLGHNSKPYLPTQRGFDHQYGHYNGALDYFTHDRDGGLDWHRDDKVCHDEGYSTFLIADEAVRLINGRDKNKPLFLYVPFNAVHAPLMVPDKYKAPYASMAEPRRTYAGMVAAMDESIGKIFAAIDQQDMRKNTLIIFCSDNGGPAPGKVTSNGPYRGGKATCYEGGTRVCAAVAWDGHIKAGTHIDPMMHMVDWYPTLLNLAGAKVEQSAPLDGIDIWPVLTQGAPSPHKELLMNSTPVGGGIRVGDWKLVVNGARSAEEGGEAAIDPEEEDGTFLVLLADAAKKKKKKGGENAAEVLELFNLANDPYEKNNLAEKDPQKLAEVKARYDFYAKAAAAPKGGGAMPKGWKVPKVWGEPDSAPAK